VKKNHKNLYFLLILAMMTWGLSWTNAKVLGSYSDARVIMVWRFTITSIFFIPIVYFTKNPFKVTFKGFLFTLVNAFFITLYNYFFLKGTHIGLAGKGGVLVTTLNPIFTSILAVFILNNNFKLKDILGLTLGLIGGAIIIEFWNIDLYELKRSGSIYFILAAFSYACVTILSSQSKPNIPFISYSFWSFLFSAIISLIITRGMDLKQVFFYDYIFWLNMIFLSIGALGFGTTIYFLASIKLGAKKASSFIFTVPITAITFAMIFLDETLTLNIIVGGFLGSLSVYIINKD
jgi:drug/metabolite transporter (DMT)-like permease